MTYSPTIHIPTEKASVALRIGCLKTTGSSSPSTWIGSETGKGSKPGKNSKRPGTARRPGNQFSKQDWEKFQAAVKRESRRLNCNALEFYKKNAWSREA